MQLWCSHFYQDAIVTSDRVLLFVETDVIYEPAGKRGRKKKGFDAEAELMNKWDARGSNAYSCQYRSYVSCIQSGSVVLRDAYHGRNVAARHADASKSSIERHGKTFTIISFNVKHISTLTSGLWLPDVLRGRTWT